MWLLVMYCNHLEIVSTVTFPILVVVVCCYYTLWLSNYNMAIKYKSKLQNELLTIILAKGLWTTSASLTNRAHLRFV